MERPLEKHTRSFYTEAGIDSALSGIDLFPKKPGVVEQFLHHPESSAFVYGDPCHLAERNATLAQVLKTATTVLAKPKTSENTDECHEGSVPLVRCSAEANSRTRRFHRWLGEYFKRWNISVPMEARPGEPSTPSKGAGSMKQLTPAKRRGGEAPYRRGRKLGSGGDNNDEGEGDAVESTRTPGMRTSNGGRKLACPFYKRESNAFPQCFEAGYFEVSRLKS